MRKIIGAGMLCIAVGMFLMLLIRDRMAGFLVLLLLGIAGFFNLYED